MNKSMLKMVRDFHVAFGQRVGDKLEFPDKNERELRLKLLREEFQEYLNAEENNDIVNTAAELADIIYIVCGTAVSYGIPLDDVFSEIHRANMNKLVDGKVLRRADGKIQKPEGWKPADIEGILNNHS